MVYVGAMFKKAMGSMVPKASVFGVAVLGFLVLSSKHILIYNEELLVALSFLCFVLFSVSAFGESIGLAFADRQRSIHAALEETLVLKASTLRALHGEYQRHLALTTTVEAVKAMALDEVRAAQRQRLLAFQVAVRTRCLRTLQELLVLEASGERALHARVVASFEGSMVDYFTTHGSTFRPQLLDQACVRLARK